VFEPTHYPLSIRLILKLLQPIQDESLSRLILQASANDWEALINLAELHGIGPYLYHQLKENQVLHQIPDNIQEKLHLKYLTNAVINMRIYQELADILRALKNQQLPVILLKGVFLAEKVYSNIALRVMSDIDLLLPRSSISNALQILEAQGYHASYPFNVDEECLHSHSLPPLYHPGLKTIDLHWNISPTNDVFNIEVESLWKNAISEIISGMDVLVLSPEDLLLHLTHHFAYTHLFIYRLFQLCDISQILEKYQDQFNWEHFIQRAMDWGVRKTVFLALRVAQELIQAPVPSYVLRKLVPNDFKPQHLEWIIEQILIPANFSINLGEFWTAGSPKQKLILFLQKVFYPPRIIQRIYPQFGRGIGLLAAYPYRMFDVTRRHFRGYLRLIKGDPQARFSAEQMHRGEQLGLWFIKDDHASK
jgi:hypothetical protein